MKISCSDARKDNEAKYVDAGDGNTAPFATAENEEEEDDDDDEGEEGEGAPLSGVDDDPVYGSTSVELQPGHTGKQHIGSA